MKPDLDELISYLPPWTRDRVMHERSATAEPGWDGRSQAVEDDTWRDAVRVLLRLGPIFTAQPRIAPCPDGSVHVSWYKPAVAPGDVGHRAAREFLVETRDERLIWTARVNGEVVAEGECPDLTQLHRLAVQHR